MDPIAVLAWLLAELQWKYQHHAHVFGNSRQGPLITSAPRKA